MGRPWGLTGEEGEGGEGVGGTPGGWGGVAWLGCAMGGHSRREGSACCYVHVCCCYCFGVERIGREEGEKEEREKKKKRNEKKRKKE
jgi:hypothetical protein